MVKQHPIYKYILLLALVLAGAGSAWAQSDLSSTYTSNVTLSSTGGSSASNCTVVIDGTQYDGLKAGNASTSGTVKISAPVGTKYLHLHIAGWNGKNVKVSFTPSNYSNDITLTSDRGISGSSPYTFSGNPSTNNYYKVITFSSELTKATTITISSSNSGFAVWGVNTEDASAISAPKFSPTAGDIEVGKVVTISSDTPGATIYYTTDGSTPTTSSTQGNSVTINENTIIKAFAVKEGLNNSIVTTAEYTPKEYVHGYVIDFENPIEDYVDWTMTNIEQGSTTISPHSGNDYGNTARKATASIQTKEKVAYPETFTCYISKHTSNTDVPTWEIRKSDDGTNWTTVKTQSATSMSVGEWVVFTADLTAYTDVYIQLYYSGSNAMHAVDDISLTTYNPSAATVTLATSGYASYCCDKALDFSGNDKNTYRAWYVSNVTGTEVTFTEITGTVKAGEGIILYGTPGAECILPYAESGDALNGNMLRGTLAPTPVTTTMEIDEQSYTLFGLSGGAFVKINDGTIPANKAYLPILTSNVPAARLAIVFSDEETTGIADSAQCTVHNSQSVYDLQGRRVSVGAGPVPARKGLYIVNGKKRARLRF